MVVLASAPILGKDLVAAAKKFGLIDGSARSVLRSRTTAFVLG